MSTNSVGNNVKKPVNKTKERMFLFIRTVLITLSVFIVVSLSGWLVFTNIVKAPEIPGDVVGVIEVDAADDSREHEGAAFLLPDGEEEDMLIGEGLHAPEGFTTEDRKEEFYTFLIVGLDGGVNTDTIMVASYDGIHKEANIIGIPRDSLVNVKRKVKKINAAFPAGTLYGGGKEGGIDQLKREIKTIIGFTPDFYVCIDLGAFVKIVDAVDGIDVNVPFHMNYDDPEQDLHINIYEGLQHLEGKEAIKFARYRKGNNSSETITDYQRIENQQAVIKAVLNKLLKPSSLLKIPEFIEIFNENVMCDIKVESILWFADQLNKIKGTDALSTYTMPTTGTSGPPMYYEYLDKESIVMLVNDTINPYIKDIETKDVDIIIGE